MTVITAFRRPRQGDFYKFKVSLGYLYRSRPAKAIEIPCLINTKINEGKYR